MKTLFYLVKKGVLTIKKEGLKIFILKFKNYIIRRYLGEYYKYKLYIKENKIDNHKKKIILKEIKKFDYEPLISIITPVYNIDSKILKKTINSVLNQIYDNWELCICDDGSINIDTLNYLKSIEGKYKRIKVIYSKKNIGISEASNEALKLAKGEYIAFIDHDDTIEPNALYEIVKILNLNKNIDLIYSDEDKITVNDKRFDPFFKPEFSLDLLLSCNYMCHFLVIKTKIIKELNGLRKEYDGNQDYDLILRVVEKTKNIYHIPKVLYHWRTTSKSTSLNSESKLYAFSTGKKAIEDYLERNNINGYVEYIDKFGFYKIIRNFDSESLISIIISTKDKIEFLDKCLKSILEKSTYKNYEIIIIDNNSKEEKTKNYFKKIKNVKNISIYSYPFEFNFSKINNFAVSKSKGDILLFLNNDTEIINNDWLERLLEHILRKDVGLVGCKLLFPNKKIQHAGVVLGLGGLAGHAFYKEDINTTKYFNSANIIRNYSAVTFACAMTKKNIFYEVGGLDENLPYNFNDIDFCLKVLQKGYLIIYTPYSLLYHYESITRKPIVYDYEIQYIKNKWSKLIENDPYYNPNLSRKRNDFGLREKPLKWNYDFYSNT